MTPQPRPQLGLGLAALGRPAYINVGRVGALPDDRSVPAMRAATWAVLDAADEAGVRWVDVARSYGRAEEFLAGWLVARAEEGRPAEVTVSSKWGYAYVGGWRLDAEVHEAKEHSLARFTQQWAETQALLGDRVALYQVHSLTADSPLFDDRPLLDALAALAAGGRVRVGFSTTGPAQAATIERGLALEVEGQRVFTAVQSTWNLLEPAAGAALAAAHRDGALVLVKETLANGRLAVPERVPAPLAAVAERHGTTPDAVALAAVLAQPWAGTVLVGPAGPDQLAANLRAAAVALTADDQAQLAALAEPPATYWHHRSTLPWR